MNGPPPQTDSISLDEHEGRELFDLLESSFERALQNVGETCERFFRVGGLTIRFRFVGEALPPVVTPALRHLATESVDSPDLTVCLWDRESTGIRMHLLSDYFRYLSWFWYDHMNTRGELKYFNGKRIRAALNPGSQIVSMLDCDRRLALYWTESAADVPWYETGAPLRTILHWWLSLYGYQLVHAASVGTSTGGALLIGKGGSGKSTAALAGLSSSLMYAGDDYCLVTADPSPAAYCLYNTAKLKKDSDLERFPHLAHCEYNPDRKEGEKLMMFVNDHFPGKIADGFPLKVILAPYVTGKTETTVQPMSAGTALLNLAPSTIVQLPGAGQAALHTMAQLIRRLPCYRLEVGTDVTKIPQAIEDLLALVEPKGVG